MKDLRITIIQSHLHWENVEQNLQYIDSLISKIENTDVIILPEMFSTGFTMQPNKYAESMNGKAVEWMQKIAAQKNIHLTGSICTTENEKFYNRLIWMQPNGTYTTYDKRHLFSMGDENKHYTAGNKKIIVNVNGWNVCPLICYDLRFPVWSRNKLVPSSKLEVHSLAYDILLYVANWPEKRNSAWKTLLPARAIENVCYVVGVNRIGEDGNGINHSGDSAAYNYLGEKLTDIAPNIESISTVKLSYNSLMEYRTAFPVINDADNFNLK